METFYSFIQETHNSMDHLLSAANYQEHKWLICGDLKVVGQVKSKCVDLVENKRYMTTLSNQVPETI